MLRIYISAMDTLTASTAGVDAAKGKTLDEMSDLVHHVRIYHKNINNVLCSSYIKL